MVRERVSALTIAPGVLVWREWFAPTEQKTLLAIVLTGLKEAPLYHPTMPGSGKPFSVQESNFGPQGWVSDRNGYRYQPTHPVTGAPWPPIPAALMMLWQQLVPRFLAPPPPPACCLVNLYRNGARMGLHQDRDEGDDSAPVIGVSLGDEALFRVGGTRRRAPTTSFVLASGDVVMLGGPARMAFHGIDRTRAQSSTLIPGGGRLSLTLRHVSQQPWNNCRHKKRPPAGKPGAIYA